MIAFAKGFVQLVVLLAELAPSMVKLWHEWQKRNGTLSVEERKRLSESVRSAVKSKDTTDLEDFLAGRKPEPKPSELGEVVK